MTDHFINLNCTNCGGKLDVYDDMERFACGYCATEMVVQRRGGTVALRAVTEAIKNVQIGTDKTAAELAIKRHEAELRDLHETYLGPNGVAEIAWGAAILLIAWFLLVVHPSIEVVAFGVVLLVVGLGSMFWGHHQRKTFQTREAELKSRITALELRISDKKRIADS